MVRRHTDDRLLEVTPMSHVRHVQRAVADAEEMVVKHRCVLAHPGDGKRVE